VRKQLSQSTATETEAVVEDDVQVDGAHCRKATQLPYRFGHDARLPASTCKEDKKRQCIISKSVSAAERAAMYLKDELAWR